MKFVLPVAFAMALAATSAQAAHVTTSTHGSTHHHHYHRDTHGVHDKCHGMSTGMAHKSCGTRTGGPAGGLH